MGKTLREKLSFSGKIVATAGLLGCLALTGCEALFGSLLSASAPYSKDPKAGQAAYVLGQGMQSNQNARDGRSTVNVNVTGQNNSGNTSADEENPLTIFAQDRGTFLLTRVEEGFIDNKKYLIITDEFIKKHDAFQGKPGLWKLSDEKHPIIISSGYPPIYERVYEFYKEMELPKE